MVAPSRDIVEPLAAVAGAERALARADVLSRPLVVVERTVGSGFVGGVAQPAAPPARPSAAPTAAAPPPAPSASPPGFRSTALHLRRALAPPVGRETRWT